ncbi:helix-turn-helix domain-containing protein [Kitasatospora sp. NPDC001603]|uniref:helix-turn-helix domain-containing protein n=1 Tax=Kitasatospora sp. NPDC001603 TaxID=3154388 RepID=UPI0033217BBA
MTRGHGAVCARRLISKPENRGAAVGVIVDALQNCCAVTRLRAHRLARAWTLEEAVRRFKAVCTRLGADPGGITIDRMSTWETGANRPRPRSIDLLCELYDTEAHDLDLAGPPHSAASVTGPVSAAQAAVLPSGDLFDRLIDDARRSLNRTLAAASVSTAQLDQLEERMISARRLYVFTPPEEMLPLLIGDLEEIRLVAADRQPATVQVQLSALTAIGSTLVADALMKLGRLRHAGQWYDTARTAADDSGDPELRARVRVQAAMLPYYYGPLETAAGLAREARLISRNRPTVTGAFAAAAEARALARQGDRDGALTAIRHAERIWQACDPGPADDAWAFPERRLLLYRSGTYTAIGDTQQARHTQDQALRLYPEQTGIDPALLGLEQAMCLIHEHSLAEACQLAAAAYLQVPEAHRTTILGARAQDVIAILPPQLRTARPVRDLGTILALPAAAK